MLNFLRKLRRNNMKNSQYFKYAFGEIILVVVGILIALGINNWNEERKISDEETRLLEKVKTENDYNIEILLEDTAYFYSIEETTYFMAENLKLPRSSKRDSIIGNSLNDVLRVVNMEFSTDYLTRYINNSQNINDDLVYDFIELNDLFKSVKISSDMVSEYKFSNIMTEFEKSIDFIDGEIYDIRLLEKKEFVNRLAILSAIEQARSIATRDCVAKAYKIDSLLNLRLNQ